MYLVTTNEKIIPCKYDQGTDSYVVLIRDYDPEDDDDISLLCIDDVEMNIVDYEIVDETRRVFFMCLYFEDDSESESDEDDSMSEYELEELKDPDMYQLMEPESDMGSSDESS